MNHSNLFKKYIWLLLGCISILWATGCDNGLKRSNFRHPYKPYVSSSTKGGACENYKPISGAVESHQRHIYVGSFNLDRNSGQQNTYRTFLADYGEFCKNNHGLQWQYNPVTGQYEQSIGIYNGVSNCSDWDDFFKVWISFPRNDSRRADVTVDATMSGYPDGWEGQGYDVQRIKMDQAQIDCSEKEEIFIDYEPVNGLIFTIKIYQGNKNSHILRAEVYYKGASLGTSHFEIVSY